MGSVGSYRGPDPAGGAWLEEEARGAVLGDDGLAEGDAEEVLRLGDPESKGVGRGALALPSEGSHADPLLGRRSLRLGGEEGRSQSGVGLLPAYGGGGERRIRGRHPEARPRGIGRGVSGLLPDGDGGVVGRSGGCWIGARGLQQLRCSLQGGRIGTRGLQQLRCGPQGGLIDGSALLGPRSPGARTSSCCGSNGVGLQGPQGGRWLLPRPLRRRRPLQRCRGGSGPCGGGPCGA